MKIENTRVQAAWVTCLLLLGLSCFAKPDTSNLELARQLNQAFVEIAERVSTSVVVITVVEKPGTPASDEEDGDFGELPPEFRHHFHQVPEEKSVGQGSGIIIRPDGYILTNRHVVEDAEVIEVRLQDGRQFKATVRGVDPQSDLAVIKIDAKNLASAALGDSNKTKVGEFALAIGAPYSLEYTVTFGHVSAKGRSNVIPGVEGASMDQDFIQTDALINPGNSGGPLVNINGEVIGVNTLIRGLHTGIGFAIPVNMAREISDKLIAEGKFTRAWLGIEIHGLRDDQDLHDLLKGIDDGVVVHRVMPDGPAAKSELKPTDVITAVDGKRVNTPQDLRSEIRSKAIGHPITLNIFRSGKTMQVKVTPTQWLEPTTLATARHGSPVESDSSLFGITVHTLTREMASQFGDEMTDGVLVVAVEKGTPASDKGIKPGDIITEVNQQQVRNPKQFREAVQKADTKKGVIVNLVSGKTARFEILKRDEP